MFPPDRSINGSTSSRSDLGGSRDASAGMVAFLALLPSHVGFCWRDPKTVCWVDDASNGVCWLEMVPGWDAASSCALNGAGAVVRRKSIMSLTICSRPGIWGSSGVFCPTTGVSFQGFNRPSYAYTWEGKGDCNRAGAWLMLVPSPLEVCPRGQPHHASATTMYEWLSMSSAWTW